VLAQAASPNRKQAFRRKITKTLKIGIFGALNGVRLRGWYEDRGSEDIVALAQRYDVPLFETVYINSEQTRQLFRQADADLGLSLGNGYIGESVFSIPKNGMINVHGEILPDFQGAQSIIWPIFEGRNETGFTIHQIDKHIDTGDILFQKRCPIVLYPTLRETVEKTLAIVGDQIPEALTWVCENYKDLKKEAKAQGAGRSYTTPSISQFRRMLRNHKVMYERAKRLDGVTTLR
jgi:methionyl-tRNA formyltransferase